MMRIVFFGTPQFAATILDYLVKQPVEIVAAVSRPDKPRGRSGAPLPTAVKKAAEKHGVPVYQPRKASETEFADFLKSLRADLFVVAAYAEILKENILDIPQLGCINVHGSALPKYRGAAPVQRALMAGEKETGVSIMKMALEMDAGDVYSIVKIPLSEEITAGELFEKMAVVGAEALWEVIEKIEKGEIKALPQDHSQATFAKKVKPEEGEIDWRRPAREIHNQIRGLTPNPGAWCWIEVRGVRKRLGIKKTRLISDSEGEAGRVIPAESKIIVSCGDGALELLEVQLEGKKSLPAPIFLRGIRSEYLKF
ncbi:MAG: methionyl-tRNA formyltransferase [Chlamydiales bacterium]|nr:methionyl-tRNA formyltransferase [Chlamydiales bacterium]